MTFFNVFGMKNQSLLWHSMTPYVRCRWHTVVYNAVYARDYVTTFDGFRFWFLEVNFKWEVSTLYQQKWMHSSWILQEISPTSVEKIIEILHQQDVKEWRDFTLGPRVTNQFLKSLRVVIEYSILILVFSLII